jgi:hypothetical protein
MASSDRRIALPSPGDADSLDAFSDASTRRAPAHLSAIDRRLQGDGLIDVTIKER